MSWVLKRDFAVASSPPSRYCYVNVNRGNDRANGEAATPWRTLTYALKQAAAGTTIYLATGTYSQATGEVFPLMIPSQVTVVGDEANQGQGIIISGSGTYTSAIAGSQAIAIYLATDAQLRGVTVTNPTQKGIGVWIEASAPIVANNTLQLCGQTGAVVIGHSHPLITGNFFQRNTVSGLLLAGYCKGEIRQNTFQNTGVGILLQDSAAPLIVGNNLSQNRLGVLLTASTRAVLRQNIISQNTQVGLGITGQALPDLGVEGDPGRNRFWQNTAADINNATNPPLTVNLIGNELEQTNLRGQVNLLESVSPAPQPDSEGIQLGALPAPPPVSTPAPRPGVDDRAVQFSDIQNHWAKAFILPLVAQGRLRGFSDGTFKPDAPITRAQFAAVLAQTFTMPLQRSGQRYVDVPEGFWAAAAIQRADRMGFLSGYADRTFRPNLNLSRVQAIVSLVGGLGLADGDSSSLTIFQDRAEIPSYALARVATATQRQMVVNYPNSRRLLPLQDITRAEVSALLYQALVATGVAPAIASDYIVNPLNLTETARTTAFKDTERHWAAAFIDALSQQRLISGFTDGTFQPEASMTRAQFASLLVQAFNPPVQRSVSVFRDIQPQFWAATAIYRACQGGFMSGFNDNTFRPSQNVSRVQILVALVNGLGLTGGRLDQLSFFLDGQTIPGYARDEVATAGHYGLVVNYPVPQWLNPDLAAKRAEVAAMIYQGLVAMGRSPAIASPYIVKWTS